METLYDNHEKSPELKYHEVQALKKKSMQYINYIIYQKTIFFIKTNDKIIILMHIDIFTFNIMIFFF